MNEKISIQVDWSTGALHGPGVKSSKKRLHEVLGLYRNPQAGSDGDRIVYRVQYCTPVEQGTPGGLFWGVTQIEPGKVGDEYFFTHGHFHALRDRAEYYATVRGHGALILMNETGRTWVEPMSQGSLHYIRGGLAHRVANTGNEPLRFIACWPSDAGHDYQSIVRHGFGARMREIGGAPVLVPEESGARVSC